MGRPRWFVALIKKAYPGRFLAARATRLPVLGAVLDRWLFAGDHLFYLPRDRVIPIQEPVVAPADLVLPSAVVDHLIEQAGARWIMDFCLCRDGNHCRDYPVELGCLFLGEATAGINPALGHPASRDEALAHVRRCRELGLIHLVGRNKLDTVWLGVGPGHKLLTICNCCPCCCLWKVLPHIAPVIGDKVQRLPGVSVTVGENCAGCGTCTRGICFVDAIHLNGGRAAIGAACRGCGRCVEVCPQGAISLSLAGRQHLDAAVARLTELVDLR